ncbi:peroxisomal 2 4-dienoyl-CoA reductase sps19 [Cystobasidiomycetes sp. EMM_F5]
MSPDYHAPVNSQTVFRNDIFKGKVLFCTGGASGICYGQTEAMMRHGCSAAIFGRRADLSKSSAAALSKATGQRCLGLSGDVRKPETLKAAVEETLKEFGRIDYVIAGAAGNFLAQIEKASENAFKTVVEIDLLGTYNTLKATLGELKKTKGSVIAVSATLHREVTLLQAHASAAKAGVDSLIRTTALEYGPFGVRANTIAPGPIAGTEGIARLLPKDSQATVKKIPLQRMGHLHDIANATVYLFSDAASYVTGVNFIVDGGEHFNKMQNAIAPYPDTLTMDFRPKAKM